MIRTPTFVHRANPFATRHVRPGRLVPRDADGVPLDVDLIVARARDLGVAAIEGPHGAGKSNLLTTLAARLAAAGLLAGSVRPGPQRGGVTLLGVVLRASPGTTLCVDGWETLGHFRGAVVVWAARLRRVGLIATTHRATGMPVLVRCRTTPALLASLVADLPDHGGLIGATDITAAFTACRGDVREALYDLYDRFERRSRAR